MRYLGAVPALLLVAAACSADASGKDRTMAASAVWHLSAGPVVSIGAVDGSPDYQLYRAMDATVLRDGSIVVVNTGNSTLAVYDREGKFLRRIGRKGQGPGEFEVPLWVGSPDGDTIVVWDQRLRRLSYFAPTGELARVTTFSVVEGAFPEAVGMLGDRSFLLGRGPDLMAMYQSKRGVWRDSTTLQRFGPDGQRAGSLGPFADSEQFLSERASGFGWNDLPFGKQTFLVATRYGLYVGDSGEGEIAILDSAGARRASLTAPFSTWTVSEEDIARHKEERLSRIEAADRRRDLEQTLAQAPYPRTSPTFGKMAVDPDGNVWVQEYRRPGEKSALWAVLGPDGQVLGQIRLPSDLEVYEVARDHVLGRRRDDLDVEHIELFAVTRP